MFLDPQPIQIQKPDIVLKLFNDKITLSKFKEPKIIFEYYNKRYKRHISSGQLQKWTFEDAERRIKTFESGLRRAKGTLNEISDKNKFYYFLTVTFNQEYINRSAAAEVHKTFKNIIKRLKYHFKGVAYVSVPEFHEDNINIHYHILINFIREPRLVYQGRSKRGHNMYHFSKLEKFKRYDCMLTVEKINENNIGYLTKYLTKGYDFPLSRKFSCSRGLNRSRLADKVYLRGLSLRTLKDLALSQGFSVSFLNSKVGSFVKTLDSADAPARPLDLSIKDTKDENLEQVFTQVLKAVKVFRDRGALGVKVTKKCVYSDVSADNVIGYQLDSLVEF